MRGKKKDFGVLVEKKFMVVAVPVPKLLNFIGEILDSEGFDVEQIYIFFEK